MNINYPKTPFLSVDLTSIATGTLFLLFLNVHHHYYDLQDFPNFSLIYENQYLVILIFISITYFIGNILFGIGYAWMKAVFILLGAGGVEVNKLNKLDTYRKGILLCLEKNEILKNEYYRVNYYLFFTNFVIGGVIATFLFVRNFYSISLFFLLTIANVIQAYLRDKREERMLEDSKEIKH